MKRRDFHTRLVRDERAAVAAEFGLLVGVYLLMLLGIIDAGRFAWTMNEAQKASQAAVRHAVVTKFVADGIDEFDFTTVGYAGGQRIPEADVAGNATCDDSDCASTLTVRGETIAVIRNEGAFNGILARAKMSFPALDAENLEVIYRHIGVGYAGDPNGSDIAPLVTARVHGIKFFPMILFGLPVTLPDIDASMTMEDGKEEVGKKVTPTHHDRG